jgi:hypothetical protein
MITQLTLGGINLLSNQILLQSFNNGSFPATVYTRSKRGGYQGTKLVSPTFASYQFVLTVQIVGKSFSDLVTQRDTFLGILGTIHSAGVQTLIATRSDGQMRQIDIKAIQVTGDISVDDMTSSILQITLEAEYPFLQSAALKSQDILIYNGGGISIPMSIPLDFSIGRSANTAINILNAGNYAAYPVFTFVGPLTNPSITNNTSGLTLSLAQTLADSAHSIIVDTYLRTVILQPSGNNGRQYASGTFWTIPQNILQNISLGNSNNTDTGKVTISWRDTWLNQ